jgi:hypothetical protein
MNTTTFAPSAIIQDPFSRGFSVFETSELLLKKLMWRTNTKANTAFYSEPYQSPRIVPNQIMTNEIPIAPPEDFVRLSDTEIVDQFNILLEEIPQFRTTINGTNVFSIERSIAYPYIYKVNKCKLLPYMSNPETTFSAKAMSSGVNILANTIPFVFGEGAWKGTFYRTTPSGELARAGTDTIKETQLSFVYDNDSGFFVAYEKDTVKNTQYPISSATPPSVSCYIYKGTYGNFSPWTAGANGLLQYSGGPVIIGPVVSSDPSVLFSVGGVGIIDNLVASSVETKSDRRLKENLVERKADFDILKIKTYDYNYIKTPDVPDLGVIAQEVEEHVPSIVQEHNGFKTVKYDRIGVLLLPIVKQLAERLDVLEQENMELKHILKKLVSK